MSNKNQAKHSTKKPHQKPYNHWLWVPLLLTLAIIIGYSYYLDWPSSSQKAHSEHKSNNSIATKNTTYKTT